MRPTSMAARPKKSESGGPESRGPGFATGLAPDVRTPFNVKEPDHGTKKVIGDAVKTLADADRLVQAALEYAGYGWRVLPIKPASKLPLIKTWQVLATVDEDQIAQWWVQWPTANVGICLGKGSGILDLECDSETAEQEYLALFDGDVPLTTTYQGQRGKHRLFRWRDDLPGGACTKLGSIEVRTGNGGKGAQSVFPPSIHPSGAAYLWLIPPSECEPAELPDAILARLWNQAGDDLTPPTGGGAEYTAGQRAALYVDTIEGSAEGGRNLRGYKVAAVLLRDFALAGDEAWPILASWNARNNPPLAQLELRRLMVSAGKYGLGVRGSKLEGPPERRRKRPWEPNLPAAATIPADVDMSFDPHIDMMAYCQALVEGYKDLSLQSQVFTLFQAAQAVNLHKEEPMNENELKAIFTLCLKGERSKRLSNQAEGVLLNSPEGAVENAAKKMRGHPAGVFKLVIVHSDPPRYELHAPQFNKAASGCIVLDARQMNNPAAIRIQALAQAEYPLPKVFDKLWSKPDGMYEALIHTAEHREAPLEQKRRLIVADRLRGKLASPRVLKEDEKPDKRGRPCLMSDGSIVFLFTQVWEELSLGADKVTRNELSEVLETMKAGWFEQGKVKFKRVDLTALARLDALLADERRTNEPI